MFCRSCSKDIFIKAKHKVDQRIVCADCGCEHSLLICRRCDRILALPNKDNQLAAEVMCPRRECKELNEV